MMSESRHRVMSGEMNCSSESARGGRGKHDELRLRGGRCETMSIAKCNIKSQGFMFHGFSSSKFSPLAYARGAARLRRRAFLGGRWGAAEITASIKSLKYVQGHVKSKYALE